MMPQKQTAPKNNDEPSLNPKITLSTGATLKEQVRDDDVIWID